MSVEGTPVNEAPPVVVDTPIETPVPKVKDPNEVRIAHLARQQKALRAEQAKLKAERDAFAKEREEVQTYRSWKDNLAKTPLEVLQQAGITQDQLTQLLVSQPQGADRKVMELEAKIEELRTGQTNAQKAAQEAQQAQYEQAVKQITTETTLLTKGNPDKYELIVANDAHGAVVELIKQTFDTTGNLMTIEDACNEVEEYLLEESVKIMNLKKIKAKMTPEPVGAQFVDVPKGKKVPFTEAVSSTRPSPTRTLTHQQVPLAAAKPRSGLSARERAILAMQGKLQE